MVIAKKVYETMHDRDYPLGFIGGGVRELYHFTEMVGGNVNITMNWADIEQLMEEDKPVIQRLFNPVQPGVLEELLEKLPQFRQAYFEGGLKVEEYEEYGPVDFFRQSFIKAWNNALESSSLVLYSVLAGNDY
jgi:transaldolase